MSEKLRRGAMIVSALVSKLLGDDWKVTLSKTSVDKYGQPVQYALKVEGKGRKQEAVIPAEYIENNDQQAIMDVLNRRKNVVCLDDVPKENESSEEAPEEPEPPQKKSLLQRIFGD